MPPAPPIRGDNFETVHAWPKVAETERFINHPRPPNSSGGIDYTSYGFGHAAATDSPSRSRSKYFGFTWWIIEILAMSISIASLVAIVIVLRVYNGRAVLELNLPNGLTLNAIIAALATVSRAALMVPVASTIMQELWLFFAKEAEKTTCSSRLSHLDLFDSASRGTWGSLTLLVNPHSRRIVASLAALVTILSLAFGTFTQQAIVYAGKVDLSSSSPLTPGNIARTETWNQTIGRPSENWFTPPFDFIAAFYAGAYTGGIAPPPVTCRSGNCTWPLTPSLAICGGCVATEPVKTNCVTKDDGYYCNYKMPSGSKLQMWDFDKYPSADGGVGFQVMPGAGAHYNASDRNRAYFTNFDLMGAPFGSIDAPALNKDMKAAECAMWMCVQTYKTSVQSGKQTEEVVSQIDDVNLHGLLYTGYPGAKEHVKFAPVPVSADREGESSFTVDAAALYALKFYFYKVMVGNITLNQEAATPSSDLMYGIWNGTTDIDSWIHNVAKSLTNVLRATDPVTYEQYNGTAQGPGVQIRWLWLLLPLVLVALALLVLVVTMIRTAFSPVEAWRGSPLTFLLFSVDEQIRGAAYGRAMDHDGFQKVVGEKEVRLVEDSGTFWKFKPC